MFGFFSTIPVHLKIYPDRIEICNLKTGETVSGTPQEPFSASRFLLSRFAPAEALARQLVKDLKLRNRRLKVLVHPMQIAEDGLTDIEKRAYRDLAEQIGGVEVYIVTDERTLTKQEAAQILSEL